jgi:hypothetical protein
MDEAYTYTLLVMQSVTRTVKLSRAMYSLRLRHGLLLR